MIKNKLLLVFLTVSPIVFSQVGIGTTNVTAMLDVNETFRFIGLSVISEINTSAILKILLANFIEIIF